MKAGLPWSNLCINECRAYVVKGYPKGSGTLPASHPVYAAGNFLNGHHLSFCSPNSYNPCSSCWNKHCYIIMRLSVVCHSRIGCRPVGLKGIPKDSGLLPSIQPLFSIYRWLWGNKFPICLLQETYCTKGFYVVVNKGWNGEIIHSYSPSAHSRAVSMWYCLQRI